MARGGRGEGRLALWPAADIEAAKAAAVLSRDGVELLGRGRDLLLVGPLDQGVYRLALRPAGFTRWTWAYDTYDGADSYAIQIDVDEKEPAALLDEGPFNVECGLSHPHFLPRPDLEWQVDLDLRRGAHVLVTPQIAEIGGALEVVGAGGTLLRVTGPAGETLELPFVAPRTVVPSLSPGTFGVQLCGDRRCEAPLFGWDAVEVRRGRTSVLEAVAGGDR